MHSEQKKDRGTEEKRQSDCCGFLAAVPFGDWDAQWPACLPGLNGWHEIWQTVERAQGAQFNPRELHHRALDAGAFPLPELRKLMTRP